MRIDSEINVIVMFIVAVGSSIEFSKADTRWGSNQRI